MRNVEISTHFRRLFTNSGPNLRVSQLNNRPTAFRCFLSYLTSSLRLFSTPFFLLYSRSLIFLLFLSVLLSSFFVPLPPSFISASPPSIPYFYFLSLHRFAFHFFHAEILSNPFITTSVYATPHL